MPRKTVRAFKNLAMKKLHPGYASRSDAHCALWQKLNRLGNGSSREIIPDHDRKVVLSDQQWQELEAELAQLS